MSDGLTDRRSQPDPKCFNSTELARIRTHLEKVCREFIMDEDWAGDLTLNQVKAIAKRVASAPMAFIGDLVK